MGEGEYRESYTEQTVVLKDRSDESAPGEVQVVERRDFDRADESEVEVDLVVVPPPVLGEPIEHRVQEDDHYAQIRLADLEELEGTEPDSGRQTHLRDNFWVIGGTPEQAEILAELWRAASDSDRRLIEEGVNVDLVLARLSGKGPDEVRDLADLINQYFDHSGRTIN